MSDVNDRTWERSAVFSGVNRNKRSLVLDMKHDRGREVFARLVAASDVVVESFSPGVVERWGFGYERLRELNERIILLSLPAAGSDGPWSHYVGYASTTEALAGLPALCGYAGGSPILQTPSIADPVAGLNGAAALAMALYEREVTGRGQAIEVAHLEAMTPLVGEALIDHALTGAIRERSGTGDTSYAPNGCYRCAGDDRWVVISAREDAEWQALAAAVGRPELADDPRFRRRTDRVANRAVVDEVVEAWTRTQDRRAAMETLQRAGVLAGAVNNEADLLDDPQVQAAGSFVDIDREHVGVHPYPNATLRLDGRRAPVRRPAPLFGEDNRHVLRSILGLDDEEIEQLYADEVVADVPTAAGRARLSSFSGTLTRHTTDVS
jgi:crotonobetainyl-CoA:carnitine CoA-transferase CaiB-like acyl-CoA transferase